MRRGCILKGEKERSCLREEIRGHLRVKQTQQRQLEKVEKETVSTQDRLIGKEAQMIGKDHFLNMGTGHNWLAHNHDSYLKPFLFILF